MYSKKVLLEALAQPPDAGAKWACFPAVPRQGGALRVWALPEKLKLLRLLGLEYAVHKKKKAPALTHAGVRGLLVEEVPAGAGRSCPPGGASLHPAGPAAGASPRVMVGARECRLGLSNGLAADIDLQAWLDGLLNIACPTPLSPAFPARLRELCGACCAGHATGGGPVSCEAGARLVRYQRTLKESGQPASMASAAEKATGDAGAAPVFSLSLHFAQVEPAYALALVHMELGGQAGHGAAAKWLHEFAAETSLLVFLEERLRSFLHDRGPRLLPEEDPLGEMENLLAQGRGEERQACSFQDVVAGAAFLDMAREQERAAERWRNIMR